MKRLLRIQKLLATGLTAGIVFQAGTCMIDQQTSQLLAPLVSLGISQMSILLSDTVFFFLDNLFVRLTA